MSDETLTDIADAILRLGHAFQKHGLGTPVRLEVANQEQMIRLAMMLRSSTQFNYATDLDAPRRSGDLTVNVCGLQIGVRAGAEMRRVGTICFVEGLPAMDSDTPDSIASPSAPAPSEPASPHRPNT